MGKHRETPYDILDDFFMMGRVWPVLVSSEKVLDAFDAIAGAVDRRAHWHLRSVHIVVKNLALLLVGYDVCHARCLRLFECYGLSHIPVIEGCYHIRVEAEHIAIAYSICNAVAVQAVAEHHGGGGAFLLVLVEDGCARESEEQGIRKCSTYILEHIAEG